MKKSGIERNLLVLAILIVVAVGVSWYLVSGSLNQIVGSIHTKATTNYKSLVIRNISIELLEIENSVRLFTLTNNKANLQNYENAKSRLKDNVVVLSAPENKGEKTVYYTDSIVNLVEIKLGIWEEVKRLNTKSDNTQSQFDELYSMLESKEIDTVEVEVLVEPVKKKGFLKRIFTKKDTATTRIETSFIERTVENEEIKAQIEALETGLKRQEREKIRRELRLIQKNIRVTSKLNSLIAEIEKSERDTLIKQNAEADELATVIYNRLSTFSIVAVVFLFIVLLLFIRYQQKANKVKNALTEAKLAAERLAKAKATFIANVSHEMRTPVNAIYGITEQLLLDRSNLNLDENLAIVLASSKHLKEVVNDTLDFSKIQAKKMVLKHINFQPTKVISEVLAILRPEADLKKLELVYRCDKELPNVLMGDPFRLKQVLLNTIGNAIKFTEKGSVTLTVDYKERSEGDFLIDFYISDTGIGISKENQELIFDDFVQIETDYTRKFDGTGLGLSIVKKLVELQNGHISMGSKLGEGTNLNFKIPYKVGVMEKRIQTKKPKLIVRNEIKALKILVVDDAKYNRHLLKTIFQKWGLQNFKEAQNGEEAIELVRENEFDLILMDLRMPKLNGIEASKLIFKDKPHSKIVVLATLNSDSDLQMFKDVGIKHFLGKPFAEEELLKTMNKVLSLVEEGDYEKGLFNLKELERLADGDSDFVNEMIGIFTRSTQNGMISIKESLLAGNWQAISEAAHKMAAPCKHLQADDLYKKLKLLEHNAENEEFLESIPNLILSIEKQVESINSSLECYVTQ